MKKCYERQKKEEVRKCIKKERKDEGVRGMGKITWISQKKVNGGTKFLKC